MELFEAMSGRRSVRRYRGDPVPEGALERILAAAHSAPSACNRQPWMFAVISEAELKIWLRERCEEIEQKTHSGAAPWFRAFLDRSGLTPEKTFLTDAPVLIAAFGERGAPYWKESTWLAIGHLVLAATAEGLSSVTYTPGRPPGLRRKLGVSRKFVLQAILPLGFAADEDRPLPERRPLDEVVLRR